MKGSISAPAAPPDRESDYDVSIIGTVGLPARYGGFETLAEQLVRRWQGRFRVQVFCTEAGAQADRPSQHDGADLTYLRWDANGWQSIPYDIAALWRAAPRSRSLLVLGVSGCIALPLARLRGSSARIVAHIDGLEWRRRKWGLAARIFLRLSEWMAVRFSDEVISDNQAIVDHVRAAYGRESTLIAYGGDHVRTGEVPSRSATRFAPGTYFFSVCRIEPENNIREILEAFAPMPDRPLVIVGNWRNSAYARALLDEFGNLAHIELKDPIYDIATLEGLRSHALAYVHGHSAGGTNPSLVEAMSFGLAIFAFDVNYNRYTTGGKARYWVTPLELKSRLANVDAQDLRAEGQVMQALAGEQYTWDRVADKYIQALAMKDPRSS